MANVYKFALEGCTASVFVMGKGECRDVYEFAMHMSFRIVAQSGIS